MSRLDSIIRFKSRALDDERRALVLLEEAVAETQAKLQALAAEEAAEKAHERESVGSEVMATEMGAYLKGVRIRRADLQLEEQQREAEAEEQRERVRDAFNELKTLEIAREREEAREAAKRAKREQDELDEQALRPFTESE